MDQKYTKRTFLLEIIGIVVAIIFLIPFYFVFINSVKGFAEILIDAGMAKGVFVFKLCEGLEDHSFSKGIFELIYYYGI